MVSDRMLDRSGRLTIPKDLRRKYKLNDMSQFTIKEIGEGNFLLTIKDSESMDLLSIFNRVTSLERHNSLVERRMAEMKKAIIGTVQAVNEKPKDEIIKEIQGIWSDD